MSQITHKAKVIKVTPETTFVKFDRLPACSSCDHKHSCALLETQTKILEIPNSENKTYSVGQEVNLFIDERTGWVALFWGYILPLIVVLLTLFSTYFFTQNEEKSAFFSLFSMFFYYFLLFFAKKHFQKKVRFKID